MTNNRDNQPWRVVDANLNRAREAYRVMEEYARFELNDAELALAIKQARHTLASSVPTDFPQNLIASRDVVGDVGRTARTPSEYARQGVADVMAAACKRLSEALRVLEEYAKILSVDWATIVEGLRYDAYELERRLVLTQRAQRRFGDQLLYVLLTESLCRTGWLETARAALEGGADCLQLREKTLGNRALLGRAKQLSAMCHDFGKLFIVNDRPDIAVLSGADGVHVGQDDLEVSALRKLVPSNLLIGVSTHTVAQAQQVISQTPDYLAVGPIFSSSTKPQNQIAGCATLSAVRSLTALPLVAIGGLSADNAADVLSAAPCCLAVCSAIISLPNVAEATRRLRASVQATRSSTQR